MTGGHHCPAATAGTTAVEYTHGDLMQLLGPELSRYEVRRLDGAGWSAVDPALDATYQAATIEELLRQVACAWDGLDLSGRPTFRGEPVLVAEVVSTGDRYTWAIHASSGAWHICPRSWPSREGAAAALSSVYDPLPG